MVISEKYVIVTMVCANVEEGNVPITKDAKVVHAVSFYVRPKFKNAYYYADICSSELLH